MGFFEGCFSYIFGDGNPNAQLEEVSRYFCRNVASASFRLFF